MNEHEIIEALTESGALLNGHFRLSSGLHSPQYLQYMAMAHFVTNQIVFNITILFVLPAIERSNFLALSWNPSCSVCRKTIGLQRRHRRCEFLASARIAVRPIVFRIDKAKIWRRFFRATRCK